MSGELARNSSGQFAPGNRGGPGFPHAGLIHQYRTAISNAVSPDELQELTRKLYELAMADDTPAREVREIAALLFARLGGDVRRLEISGGIDHNLRRSVDESNSYMDRLRRVVNDAEQLVVGTEPE